MSRSARREAHTTALPVRGPFALSDCKSPSAWMRFYRLTSSRYIGHQKESPQDNGGAAYLLTDTFGLCRAGRRVRHDAL